MHSNPTTDYLVIKSEKMIQAVRLFTFDGRLVQVLVPPRDLEVRIQLSNIAVGIYFVVIETEGGISNMTQLIIE
jgi:uncharacterized membrane protein YjfL (UPF0719 family)